MLRIEHGLKCKSVSSKRHRRQGEALQASAQGNALWSSAAGAKVSPERAKAEYAVAFALSGLGCTPDHPLHRALPCADAFGALPLRSTSLEKYCRNHPAGSQRPGRIIRIQDLPGLENPAGLHPNNIEKPHA